MRENEFPGLDYDFLRYVGVTPESQRRIQSFYLKWMEQCGPVLDLGCGDGDFLTLLTERGVPAIGIDSDEKSCQAAHAQGLDVRQEDVFDFLPGVEPGSIGGIFSAHLVEHLPYQQVIRLIDLCYRALRPGGVLILATPDTRTLFSHLEMFYLHFGHVTFYHPRLLCFLMEHAGLVECQYGVNEATASGLMPQVRALAQAESPVAAPIRLAPLAPSWQTATTSGDGNEHPDAAPGGGTGGQMHQTARKWWTPMAGMPGFRELLRELQALHGEIAGMRAEVQTLRQELADTQRCMATWSQQHLDGLTGVLASQQEQMRETRTQLRLVAQDVHSLNGPFECYAVARKPIEPVEDPVQPA